MFGGQLTEGDIIDGINEDAFYYWDIIDVIRENENIRNLVFRKLIALNSYSEEYKDFKGILDEINDIRWKQQEEYDEMRQDEAKRKEEEERKKREAEYQQEDDGIDVADEALDLNNDMIELIEGFAQSSPEIQALLQAQKEKYAKMAEEREEFEYSEEEIETLAEREAKSKEARDAGFEINEYGEIIRPAREETPRPLEYMPIEELQSAVQQNNKTIKQALIKRLLGQQKIIAGQEAEIARLSNQKEL